jgi:hypothetical protein
MSTRFRTVNRETRIGSRLESAVAGSVRIPIDAYKSASVMRLEFNRATESALIERLKIAAGSSEKSWF